MDYSMISKVEKAKLYAREPGRFHFESFTVTFAGDNNPHTVRYEKGVFKCDCDFFTLRGVCSHSMALERILGPMVTAAESQASTP